MPKLPPVSGNALVKFLEKQGFEVARQKGSHVSLRKATPEKTYFTVVPLHKTLAVGTLSGILRQCGISHEDFMGKYRK